ncbi:MAG: hypothetical protein AAF649_01160 [Verrucomicrobiota bacterium]
MSFTTHTISKFRLSPAAVLLLPALIYYAILAHYHFINVPRNDDFSAILDWLIVWNDTAGFQDKASWLLQQHYSHRILTTRIITLLSTINGGVVSLVFIQITGWACWFLFVLLLIKSSKRLSCSTLLTLATGLLLFNPVGSSNFITAMQGPQNLGIHLLTLSSFLLATRAERTCFALALIIGSVAVFTSANGLIVLPLIASYYGFQGRWKACGSAVISSVGVTMLYFYGFEKEPTPWLPGSMVNQFFVMLGSPFCLLKSSHELAFWVGIPIALSSAMLLLQFKLINEKPVAWLFLAFLFGSCLMAALGRMGWPDDYMIQDRYRVYGLLILVMLISLAPAGKYLEKYAVQLGILGLAAIFWTLGYLNNSAWLVAAASWKKSTAINAQLDYAFPYISLETWPKAQKTLTDSVQLQIYHPPRILKETKLNFQSGSANPPVAQTWEIIRSDAGAGYWLIPRIIITPRPDHAFIILPDNQAIHLPSLSQRAPLKTFLSSGKLIAEKYKLTLPLSLEWNGAARLIETDINQDGSLAIRSESMLTSP